MSAPIGFLSSYFCGTAIDGSNIRSLTETSPATHILPVKHALQKIGSAGALLPNLEARLVDDDGNDVEPGRGVSGELWMRECNRISSHSHTALQLIAPVHVL